MNRIESEGYPFVVVIGHPDFYSRIGFKPARRFGVITTFKDIQDEAFMIRLFKPAKMKDITGVAQYRSEFDEIT